MSKMPGYTGKIARIDLTNGKVTDIPTENYTASFIGGRGIAEKIYWDEVPPEVKAFDPENRLIFATGPCSNFKGLAGGRWTACGKSSTTNPEFFSYSNLGGSWGGTLKAGGFDGMVIQGRAEKPVYILVEDGKIEVKDASEIWKKGTGEVREILKSKHGDSMKVLSTGLAGDNMVPVASLLADNDSSGSGGLGAVMGSKHLKAVAVRGSGTVQAAHPQRLQELLERIAELKKDVPQSEGEPVEGIEKDPCYVCTDECNRGLITASDGSIGKVMCQSSAFYKDWAKIYYGEINEVPLFATRLCNHYGLNTKSVDPIITWLNNCHQAGLLNEKSTGLPLTKIGSLEFIKALTGAMANRQGFGDILAQGFPRAAQAVGNKAVELLYDEVTVGGDKVSYSPKAFITTGILYATDRRQPIQQLHEISLLSIIWVRWANKNPGANLSSTVFRGIAKRFWGSEIAGDFSTYEGKALAARMIQDRQLAKECLILCDKQWPF
ncbi:MAG: aldehyde ferredoxin oxidoreductase N-terminal domain-containing protein, partial [Dehalococcoidia bacterium]|nr:aldehyde ferredoxin oxidoreductase N-terminal domain-containing protein [Dehalococcoidia bacterium]